MNKNCGASIEVTAPGIKMIFGPDLDLRTIKVGTEETSFEGRSAYGLCGLPAEVLSTHAGDNRIQAELRNTRAHGDLEITGGGAITIRCRAQAHPERNPEDTISNVSITFPFPVNTEIHVDDTIWAVEHMPVGKSVTGIKGWWLQQFLLASCGGLWTRIGSKSTTRYFPGITLGRTEDCATITWQWQPKSPFPKSWETPALRLETFDSLDSAVEDYKTWADMAFSYRKLEKNPYAPAWLLNTRLVLALDLWLCDGTVLHDFQDVRNLISELNTLGIPKDTIIYLTGWHYPYDGHYPEYKAAERLGGDSGLRAVVTAARSAGYKVMLHTNYWGMDPRLPDFPEFAGHEATNENYWKVRHYMPLLPIRPSVGKWRKYLVGKIADAVTRYNLDAVFLDQSFAIMNDPECDFDHAIPLLMDELRAANPGVFFASEIPVEPFMWLAPLCHWFTHNVYSLHDYWPPESQKRCRRPSNLRQKLYGEYVRFFAHLWIPAAVPTPGCTGEPNPFQKSLGAKEAFKRTQECYDQLGCIKTLRLNYGQYGIDEATRLALTRICAING